MLVDGTIFACLIFSYFYLWTVTDSPWPPGSFEVPDVALCVGAAAAWLASSALWSFANRRLRVGAARGVLIGSIAATLPLAWVAFMLTMQAIGAANVQPDAHAYGAVLYAMLSWQGLHAVLVTLMGGYTITRVIAGMVDDRRRNTFDNTRLMWHYTVAQGLVAFSAMQSPSLLGS